MLKIEDYYPINKDKLKKRWDEIMNIPNDQWNLKNIDREIEVINDSEYPYTLRTVKLNMLPALAIEILNEL